MAGMVVLEELMLPLQRQARNPVAAVGVLKQATPVPGPMDR